MSCGSTAFFQLAGWALKRREQGIETTRNSIADIVWTVDVSVSMGDNQVRLASTAQEFFKRLQAAGVDFRVGEGEIVNLPMAAAHIWTSNPGAADVYVSNPRQIHLFGKDFGATTIFATAANGKVIWSAAVFVSQNGVLIAHRSGRLGASFRLASSMFLKGE